VLFSLSFEVDVLIFKDEWLAVFVLIGWYIMRLYTVLKQHSVSKCFIKSSTCFSVVTTAVHRCLWRFVLRCVYALFRAVHRTNNTSLILWVI